MARKGYLHLSVAESHRRTNQGEIPQHIPWVYLGVFAQTAFREGGSKAVTAALISKRDALRNQEVFEKLLGSCRAHSPFTPSPDQKPKYPQQKETEGDDYKNETDLGPQR